MSLADVFEMASQTHPGMVRSHNEDSLFCDPELGLAILADGMGGYNAGEVASGITVSLLNAELRQALARTDPSARDPQTHEPAAEALMREYILRANTSVYQAAQSQPQYAGMGTTLVMALFHDNRVTVGHIGDSRMYRLRGEILQQLTRDHSLLQEQIDSGVITPAEARQSQNKNLVTRALGIDSKVEPEIHSYEVRPDDVYLLCSDGLNDMVEDELIRSTLTTMRSSFALAANQLVQMANDNGGRDNVSVILVKIKREFAAERSWMSQLLTWIKK
jgi:PPM family protein phosphatase